MQNLKTCFRGAGQADQGEPKKPFKPKWAQRSCGDARRPGRTQGVPGDSSRPEGFPNEIEEGPKEHRQAHGEPRGHREAQGGAGKPRGGAGGYSRTKWGKGSAGTPKGSTEPRET